MMEKTLTLPRLGETMEEGTVLAWSKISGEEYDRGDILLELETDKMVVCLLYTSPSPRDVEESRMPSSA